MMKLFVIPPCHQLASPVDSVLVPQGKILPWLLVAVSSPDLHQLVDVFDSIFRTNCTEWALLVGHTKVFLQEIKAYIGIIDLKPVHLRWICVMAPFVQNLACLEQRNTVPKPWGTQGEDSSLPLLLRVWTAGYTSQTSCSLVQTWISSNMKTPWPYQIAKASFEASWCPLRLKSLWVVFRPLLTLSTFLVDDFHRKGCYYYICVIGFALQKRLHMQIT